tara:strand:- start:796 stop:1458 length:663 start_codon:yes stop_codon:yes gene_type:complete
MNSPAPKTFAENVPRVIVFTRHPDPGKTKTRMIPALGPVGAANLQAALTRHTLAMAQEYCDQHPCELEVRFTGGDAIKMGDAFGSGRTYRPQSGEDLGARMAHAVADAFAEHATVAVLIGSDCPDITPTILDEAVRALSVHDVVVGPAIDGGYYLIAVRQNQPLLFEDIQWGSDCVLRQTLAQAKQAQLRVHCLQTLSDVDHPQDLVVCRRHPDAFPELP